MVFWLRVHVTHSPVRQGFYHLARPLAFGLERGGRPIVEFPLESTEARPGPVRSVDLAEARRGRRFFLWTTPPRYI